MLIKLWPRDWIYQLKKMNQKVDEENGKQLVRVNVWYRKFRRFSISEFWKNIGCLVSAPTFGLGGSRLWGKEEEQKLSGKKRKRRSIRAKVDLYEVCFLFMSASDSNSCGKNLLNYFPLVREIPDIWWEENGCQFNLKIK